jgi:hypothetical protein
MIISTFDRYRDADAAVQELVGAGYDMRDLGIIPYGFHPEYPLAFWKPSRSRMKLWTMRGMLSGATAALVLASAFTPAPLSGDVFALGYSFVLIVCMIEGAAAAGLLGMASAMACDIGEQRNGGSVFGRAVRVSSFQVVARGTAKQAACGRSLISSMSFGGNI